MSDPVADALVPGRGSGLGHVSYTIKAKPTVATGTQIHNVALISFDNQPVIATNQIDPHNPAAGTSASKEAIVPIDSGAPTGGVQPLPAASQDSFTVNWPGSDDALSSGIALRCLCLRQRRPAHALARSHHRYFRDLHRREWTHLRIPQHRAG